MLSALDDAQAVLREMQDAVDSRDVARLTALFDDPAVLIGTSGDGRDREGVVRYLTEVATQPESLRWEWREVVPFHHDGESVGAAAFGDIVAYDAGGELLRAPIRLTVFAVRSPDGWRLRQFHGSIPAGS